MEQAANQFAKGLQLDTHPMVQGNDTMSDCLNGTFVTMNGDEVILQNDMGNRKVDNAFLPAGYEPVGIKEYGGIIYLALYNPITNKSQLGSFPSPERIIESNNDNGIQINFIPKDETYRGQNFLKTNYEFSIISSDTLLRAGDKFSLYWNVDHNNPQQQEEYINIIENLSNYNNITEWEEINQTEYQENDSNYKTEDNKYYKKVEKVTSPKNKKYTLRVGVLNSQNEFVDITDNLIRWTTSGSTIDVSNKTDLYKQNVGYFIQESFNPPETFNEAKKDKELIELRQAFPVNTYAYKLVGPLCVKQIFNTIQQFSYNVYAIQTWQEISAARYNLTLNQGGISNPDFKKEENGHYYEKHVELTIVANITYNCPDGVVEGSGSDDNYYTYDEGKINEEIENSEKIIRLNGFDLYNANNQNYSEVIPIPNGKDSNQQDHNPADNRVIISREDGETKYDPSTGLYNVTITKIYSLAADDFFPCDKIDDNTYIVHPFKYFIGVDSGFKKENEPNTKLLLRELSEENSINLSDIQSGGINLDYWRYFVYDEQTFDLTYRFSVYPKYGQKFDNLRIKFIPLKGSTNTSSDANARPQDGVVDDGDIQQGDYQQHDNVITDSDLPTIIRDKTGEEYTLLDDGQGNTIAVDTDGNEHDPDELDGYVLSLHMDDSIEEITIDYKVKYDKQSDGDPQLYGNYQIFDLSNKNTTSEDDSTTENPPSNDEPSSGTESSNPIPEEYIFKLGDGSVSNGRVTYNFTNNDITIDGKQFPDNKNIMYKVELLVDDTIETTTTEKVFKRFLLNTTLFNNNYSITSNDYVEDFKNFNQYHSEFLEVKLDLDSKESINVNDPIITSTGSPIKISSNNINYDVCTKQTVQLNSSGTLYIHNEGLYPNYMKFIKNYAIQEYSPQGTNKNLYDQVTWHNWPDSESDKPQANDMFEVGTTSLSGNYTIKNHDKLKSTGQQSTETLENVFIPVEEAFQKEFGKVHNYSGITLDKDEHSGDDDEHFLQVRLHRSDRQSDDDECIKLATGLKDKPYTFYFSEHRVSIFTQLNRLSTSLTFIFRTDRKNDRTIYFNNDDDSWNVNQDPNSIDYARVWWKCYNNEEWVLLTSNNYPSLNINSLIPYNSNHEYGEENSYILKFCKQLYPYLFAGISYSESNKHYICYYVNTNPNILGIQLYVPGLSKYNEEYSLPLGFGVTWYVNGNLNIEEDDNYYIPKFWINDSSTKEYTDTVNNKTYKVYTDIIINPKRTIGHMYVNSDSDFFNLIDNYRTMLKNVIIDGNNMYIKDSKGRNLSYNKIYVKNNDQLKALTQNPIKLSNEDGADTYTLLCNSYQIKSLPTGLIEKNYKYDHISDGDSRTSLYYDKVPQPVPVYEIYEP